MIHVDRVQLVVTPVDGRWGIEGLSQYLQNELNLPLVDGSAYLFTNRRRNRIKCLHWDGNGVWLMNRRLHAGAFVWPDAMSKQIVLSDMQWQWLVSGADWQRLARNADPQWRI